MSDVYPSRVWDRLSSQSPPNRPVQSMFGVPINALTMDQVLLIVEETIENRGRLLIGVVNAAKLVNMRRDEALRRAVLSADMILADGISVVWAARLLNRRLPERVAGINLMHGMLQRGQDAVTGSMA